MGFKEILEFVKVEHTLFSLPFVLIGYVLAHVEFGSGSLDLFWILLAAVGARGLAMVLNRIIDSDIDAENPRTASRHLPSGLISKQTAFGLAVAFLVHWCSLHGCSTRWHCRWSGCLYSHSWSIRTRRGFPGYATYGWGCVWGSPPRELGWPSPPMSMDGVR